MPNSKKAAPARRTADREVTIPGTLVYIRQGDSRLRATVAKADKRAGKVSVEVNRTGKRVTLPTNECHFLRAASDR